MHCPFCRHPDSRVIDSRSADDGAAIRRRRSCPECGRRFTTQETVLLMVAKRSGVTEPFTRDKIIAGVRRACQGRPVERGRAGACWPSRSRRRSGPAAAPRSPSHEVGLAILGPLRELDEVAYLRFASVYRGFESLTDFEAEIERCGAARQHAASDAGRPSADGRSSGTARTHPTDAVGAGRVDPRRPEKGEGHDGDGERRRRRAAARARRKGLRSSASTPARACTRTTRSPGSAATSS